VGATALLPEMHRVVVEQHHWLRRCDLHPPVRDRPGGARAERAGRDADRLGGRRSGRALAATLAMCLPMSILIYLLIDRWEGFAGRRWQKAVSLGSRRWRSG
jgi:chromate transporter